MSNLYISDTTNGQVQVAELALLTGKQQMVLGDFSRDLILRTSGNLQIQVGNKFYPIAYNTSTSTGSSSSIATNTTILALDSELATLAYPGDGNYIFVRESGSFYIASNNKYVKLNDTKTSTGGGGIVTTDSALYLSYSDNQTLTGLQKGVALLNIGEVVHSFNDILTYTKDDVYTNQIIYNADKQKHYILTDSNNPTLESSWRESYLSLLTGGIVEAGITINTSSSTILQSPSALHIVGDYSNNNLPAFVKPTISSSILTIGDINYTTGASIWTNSGSVYLSLLSTQPNSTFYFKSSEGNNIFLLSGRSAAINTNIDQSYALSVGGNTLLKGNTIQQNNLTSTQFIQGSSGFGITQSTNDWSIEADYIIARKGFSSGETRFNTRSINGSQIANYEIILTEVDFVETFPIYITASSSGLYTDTSNTVKSLEDRATNARVLHIPISDLDTRLDEEHGVTDPTLVYETIALSYAIGDVFDDTSIDTSITYNQNDDSTYYTPEGNVSYDSGSNSFIPDISGDLLQINGISVYYIRCNSSSLIVGDLLYYKQWNTDKEFIDDIKAEIVFVTTDGGYYIYVYDEGSISVGTTLLKVGSTDGSGAMLQTNASDIYNPYTELLSGITSLNSLFGNYHYERFSDFPGDPTDMPGYDFISNSQSLQSNTRVKIGDLSNIIDSALSLSTQQYGLYSDNVYLKGNLVVNRGVYNNISDVTSDIPGSRDYTNFLMLNLDNMLEQVDMSVPFSYWNNKADKTITILPSGPGLLGGGDLSANRTFSLDFIYLDARYGLLDSYVADEIPSGAINGSNTVFTLVGIPSGGVMVFLRGLLQIPTTDYSLSSSVITFVIAPLTGDSISCTYTTSSFVQYIPNEVPSGTINGTNLVFTLANTPRLGSQSVFLRGLSQRLTNDYTIAGLTITFITAPLTGDSIAVTYIKN